MIQLIPEKVQAGNIMRVEYRLSAPLHIFQINGMDRWPVEMNPVEGPKVIGTLMEVRGLAVDEHTIPWGNDILLFVIIQEPSAGIDIEEQIRYQIPSAADMGLNCLETADFL